MIDIARERSYPTPLQNSPLLTMMLMTLATQKNSPTRIQTPSTINSEYDYIIVGAGSAGSVVAGRLSELSCVSVLLLEAGKAPPLLNDIPVYLTNFWDSDLDWVYKTTPQKYAARLNINRQVSWPSGKGLGGSSLLNGMLYVRGNRKNYNDWEAQGAKGWSYEDVLPYFKKLEDYQDSKFGNNGYHGVGGPVTVETCPYNPMQKKAVFETARSLGYEVVDSNGARQTGFYDPRGNTRNGQRCSSAKAYLVPAENRTNLHVLTDAFVNKVIIKNKTAVGVSFDVNGTMHQVKAKREVIMSAGTVNTAQLLMLSGIGPKEELEKHNISTIADLPVGKNLQDHCGSLISFEVNASIPSLYTKISSPQNIRKYIKNRTGPLCTFGATLALAFLKSNTTNPKVDDPNHQLYFFETVAKIFRTYSLDPQAYEEVYQPYENKTLFSCLVQLLKPRSIGYVRLQSSNPHDPPVINPKYYKDRRDLQDIVDGMRTCYKFLESPQLKKLGAKPLNTTLPGCEKYFPKENEDVSEEYLACLASSLVISQNHQVGTAKMGDPSDPTTVVDTNLRVKGISGLRVVDASIMPIIPSGNTHIPAVMVAEKGSDIIKENLKCMKGRL